MYWRAISRYTQWVFSLNRIQQKHFVLTIVPPFESVLGTDKSDKHLSYSQCFKHSIRMCFCSLHVCIASELHRLEGEVDWVKENWAVMTVSNGRQTTSVHLTGAHIFTKILNCGRVFLFSLDMPLTFITAITVFTALILNDKLELGLVFFIKLSTVHFLSNFSITIQSTYTHDYY